MTALILSLFSKGTLYMVAAAAVAGFLAWFRNSTVKAERARVAKQEAKARDVADEVDNDIGAMTPEQRREALKKWAKS